MARANFKQIYYCLLKDNRQLNDSSGQHTYQRVDALDWSVDELQGGKRLKIKGFPKDHKVQYFRVEVSTHRTDFVVTNDFGSKLYRGNTTGVWLSLED